MGVLPLAFAGAAGERGTAIAAAQAPRTNGGAVGPQAGPWSRAHGLGGLVGQHPSANVAAAGLAIAGLAVGKRRRRDKAALLQKPAVRRAATGKVVETAEKCLLNNYGKRSLVLTHGEGQYIFDSEGKRYLDFTSGIAVNCLGHADAGWVEAVQTQAAKLTHTSNLWLTEPQVELGRKLTENSFA